MYTILWEFHVPTGRRAEFEAAYDARGPWAQLFRQAPGFAGVALLRCAEQPGRYVTIDRWQSRADFDAFKRDFGAHYDALDRRLEGIADSETRIGAFEDTTAGT